MSNNRSNSAENNEKGGNNKEKVALLLSNTEKNEINELKSDVYELSNEVKTAVVDLKKSIVDIRSSVSEMENPFNLLRTISSDKDGEEQPEERKPSGVKSLILGKPEKTADIDNELPPPKLEPISLQIAPPIKEEPEIAVQPPITPVAPVKPVTTVTPPVLPVSLKSLKASAYIDWIWDLLDAGLTADSIKQLSSSCELFSYLPTQASELIYSLAVTAEKIRLLNLTKGHLLLYFYKAAAISKMNIDSEDMETLITITEHELKKPKSNEGTR